MFINPETAIKNGWISGIKNPEKQIQPNAIDFTLDKAFSVNISHFYIDEEVKEMRGGKPITPEEYWYADKMRNAWNIPGHDMVDCLSDIYVELPRGIAAQLVIRSSLARNGLILTSGLYDSGFKGHIGFLIHNLHDEPAVIAPGTRVGQIIFVNSDAAGVYAGGYNHEEGTDLDYQA